MSPEPPPPRIASPPSRTHSPNPRTRLDLEITLRLDRLVRGAGGGGCACAASEWGCAADAAVEALSADLVAFCAAGPIHRARFLQAGGLLPLRSALTALTRDDTAAAAALAVLTPL
eukprot:8796832-Pyramimonas_sp.AAC.1